MASKGKEGEDPPMRPEEVMATLCTMREIVDDLYQRVQRTGEAESSVKAKGGGEGGGPSDLLHHHPHHHLLMVQVNILLIRRIPLRSILSLMLMIFLY
jgi:hypothetical protein